jgi:hypothetical protein
VGAGLAQRGVAVHRDHREAAAFAGAVVFDDLAAEDLDHLLEVEIAIRVLVVAEPVLGPDHVAAVERADPQAGQRPLDEIGEAIEPVVLDQQPEEVFVREAVLALLVGEALAAQHLVDVGAIGRVGVEALLALALGALTGRADVHHRQPGLLGEGEGPRVERVGELLVVLGDDPGAAAVGAVEFNQLDPELLGDDRHRAVQLGREAARDAAWPVSELHASSSTVSSGSGTTSSSPEM